jgi:hypothetical protein
MYVGVLHTVTDKSVWATKLVEFEKGSPPDGYANPITFIGAQTDYAFCLWDVPSVEALQPMLDGLTEGAATNMYFAVDPEAFGTHGIPSQRIDLDTKAAAKR